MNRVYRTDIFDGQRSRMSGEKLTNGLHELIADGLRARRTRASAVP